MEVLNRQPSLLVLDNFEHLLGDAGVTDLIENGGTATVQALLARAPTLTLLVTSRQVLGLSAEREFALHPLPTPGQGDALPERLSTFDSVRLFIDRAQAVRPDFQVTGGNAPAIAALCDGLEGIPLALELAAARAQVMTPARMLAQLGDRFAFLSGRKRDVGERQRTLKGAIDWSFRLLSPELQRFFCRLSVFRGGWSAESAEAVCEEPLALDYLAQLRDGSLVLSAPPGAGGEDSDEDTMRFFLLETLREYGWEQLKPEERARLAHDHARHFVAMSQELGKLPDDKVRFNRLETDHDNLRSAFAWSQASESGTAAAEVGLQIAQALARFRWVRGYLRESLEDLERALEHAPGAPPKLRMDAYWAAAWVSHNVKPDGQERRHWLYEQALRLAREQGLRREEGWTLNAMMRPEEALPIFREIGEEGGVASALMHMGLKAIRRGEYAEARALCQESVEINERIGRDEPTVYAYLGQALRRLGEYDAAWTSHQQSLTLYRSVDHRPLAAWALCNLSGVALARGDAAQARTLVEEALPVLRRLGANITYAVERRGFVALYEQDMVKARACAEESLALCEEARQDRSNSLLLMGLVTEAEGNPVSALAFYRQALALARDASNRPMALECLDCLAAPLAPAPQDRARAARLVGAADALRERMGAVIDPVDRPKHETRRATLGAALGEEAFIAAWEAGRALSWEEAAAYALSEDDA